MLLIRQTFHDTGPVELPPPNLGGPQGPLRRLRSRQRRSARRRETSSWRPPRRM